MMKSDIELHLQRVRLERTAEKAIVNYDIWEATAPGGVIFSLLGMNGGYVDFLKGYISLA